MLHPQQTVLCRQYSSQLLRAMIRLESLSDTGMNLARIDSSSLLQRLSLDRMNPMPSSKNADKYLTFNVEKIQNVHATDPTCDIGIIRTRFGRYFFLGVFIAVDWTVDEIGTRRR